MRDHECNLTRSGARSGRGETPPAGTLRLVLTHDADKLIRQLSLVAYLMAEQRPVTARDVKTHVEGYSDMGDEAFARRYYADRRELQDLGIPIASSRDEFTSEELYSLREEQYFLPPIELTDDELAALQTSFYLLEGQFAYAEPLRLALQNLALGPGLAGHRSRARRRPPSSSWRRSTRPRSRPAPGQARAGDLEAAHRAGSATGRSAPTTRPSAPSTRTACGR